LFDQRHFELIAVAAVMLRIGGGNDRAIHYVHDVNRGHKPDASH
jgi:hypothetical protein